MDTALTCAAGLNNANLVELSRRLPSTLLKSREGSTLKRYLPAYLKWKEWAKSFEEISIFPAQPIHVSLYLLALQEKSSSYSSLESAFYGLKWFHSFSDSANPLDHPLPKLVLEAAKRSISKPKRCKQPIQSDILKVLCNKYATKASTLMDKRFLCMCLLAYAGFLRFGELINLQKKHVQITSSHIQLTIDKSKTDVYREGHKILIAASHLDTCPVKSLSSYFQASDLHSAGGEAFIFRKIVTTKKGQVLDKNNAQLSYSRARDILHQRLRACGYDPKLFGLHSFRSGGASSAANNGISDRLLKRHGRWRSEQAKDRYILDSKEKLLSISARLGI